jgi:hypothetical protein
MSYGKKSDVGPEGLSYYKGTSCPVLPLDDCGFKARADIMLLDMLRSGSSIDDIGDNLTFEMDEILETYSRGFLENNKSAFHGIKCVMDKLNLETREEMMEKWYLNVHGLLKINRLENDDMNGMLYLLKRATFLEMMDAASAEFEMGEQPMRG